MAHVDRSFHMDEPPPEAQRRFEEEVGWELHQDEGFALVRERPGQLRYNDGAVDELADEEAFEDREVANPDPYERYVTPRNATEEAYGGLRELLGRRIKVELTPEGDGTRVRIHGHAEGRLRHAIDLLGTSGYWPEVRMLDGAPTEDS
jgi:hypothetical protein